MDNPNPIRYSDLITPDDSITKLISQLDALIEKYETAKSKIQGAAADAAKAMNNLSGATEEQRVKLKSLSEESDKLAASYKKSNDAESEVYRRRQQVTQAVREQQRIDRLVVELNNSKEGSYNRLSAQYRLNMIRLNEMSRVERFATETGRKLEAETKAMREEMSRLQQRTGNFTLEVGHYQNALKALPGPIGQVVSGLQNMGHGFSAIAGSTAGLGAKLSAGVGVALTGVVSLVMTLGKALSNAQRTMRKFEQANANLATILGTTRDKITLLTNSAQELGRSTEYTASQVTQLQTELAKLGFQQGQIVAMSKSVLQFATAVGAGLGEAAEVAGSTLRAFNLTANDSEDALATLAVATNNSALSFDKIRTSIGTVFPVANAYGLTLKDTAALLGALANAGFDASSAATATRNIILNLANANGKLAQRLGGSVKTFDDIMNALIRLRESGADLNEMLELTDKRSVAAFSAFVSGAESAKTLRDSLEDVSGELDRIEKERLNTTEGATLLLKSAWEGLTLAFSNSQGVIRDTIVWLTNLVTATRELLFPGQVAIEELTKGWTEDLRERVRIEGKEAADAYIEGVMQGYRDKADTAANELESGLWRGFGRRRAAKRAIEESRQELVAIENARQAVYSQLDEQAQQRQRAEDMAANEAAEKQQELTKKQVAAAKKAAEQAKRQRIADRRAVIEAINLEIAVTEAGTQEMLDKRLDKVEAERQLELEMNRQRTKTERQDEAAINAKYDKARLDTIKNFNAEVAKLSIQRLQAEQQGIQVQIAITEDGTDEMLQLRLANIEKQRQIEIEQNKLKAEAVRQDEAAINAKYRTMALRESANFNNKLAKRDMDAARELAQAEFDLLDKNERQKTIFRLEQERKRLEDVLKLNETATEKMTADEVAAVKKTIEGINKERERLGYDNIYELLGIGLDSNQQDALNTAISSVKDSLSSLIDSYSATADAARESADARVEAAQKALDAEMEARKQGYANDVATAQAELALAKKTQEQATADQKKAQKAQAAIDALTQSSSLVTATANIWKALSGIPVAGPGLAVAAIATMWGTFLASKIRAAQVTKEEYGEGTVELLQGGSHASGNDIDLGTKPDGTRRRAEGGEYFAVINKRSSKRYGRLIPDVITAFNDGTFADKYQRANALMSAIAVNTGTDVGGIERDVAAIRRQGDESRFVDARGREVIRYKNLERRISR